MAHPGTNDQRRGLRSATGLPGPLADLPVPFRGAVIGGVLFGIVGGVVGLVVGLVAYPPTAWFAIFELGLPAAFVGVWVGLFGSAAASLARVRAESRHDPMTVEPRGPDVIIAAIVTAGAIVVVSSLKWMDWASRVDGTSHTTIHGGPTRLLVVAALMSAVLSLAVVITRWRSLRLLLVAATLLTAGAAVAVALTRIAVANTFQTVGTSATSYEPGAAVGVLAAGAMVAVATTRLLTSRTPPVAIELQPPSR